MIGLLAFVLSLICSAGWLSLHFGGRDRKIFGLQYETLMFLSGFFAFIAFIFLRVGI